VDFKFGNFGEFYMNSIFVLVSVLSSVSAFAMPGDVISVMKSSHGVHLQIPGTSGILGGGKSSVTEIALSDDQKTCYTFSTHSSVHSSGEVLRETAVDSKKEIPLSRCSSIFITKAIQATPGLYAWTRCSATVEGVTYEKSFQNSPECMEGLSDPDKASVLAIEADVFGRFSVSH
jgi:hypothetical protein